MRAASGYGLYTFVLPRPDICADAPQQLWVEVAPGNFAAGGVLEEMVLTSAETYFPQPALLPLPDCAWFELDDVSFGYNVVGRFAITAPAAPPDPQRVGSPVSVTFRITNTGESWITALPLSSSYDPAYLTFASASPPADDSLNDGELTWQDLTSSLGAHSASGAVLPPGAGVTVVITFRGVADTNDLPGGATIITAASQGAFADPDGPSGPLSPLGPLPTRTAAASVVLFVPTGLTLSQLGAEAVEEGVLLTWQTESEADILGFNVLRRSQGDGRLEPVNPELIVAEHAGAGRGARYACLDGGPKPGVYGRYVLEVVLLDGRIERRPMPPVDAGN